MNVYEEQEMTVEEFKKMLESENGVYEIETPQGWVLINEFFDRGERESCYVESTSKNLVCSLDHLLFSNDKWVKAEDLSIGQDISMKNSNEKIEKIERVGKKHVYDIWINSPEHAYYSNEFISHNCGKTETARCIADNLGMNFIKLDMSEYALEMDVNKLIGTAPGFVGYEQGGALTESVIKHPNSIVLLDEIEKAHPRIFNLLLQAMDDGFLTDNNNRKADFKNVVLIMTSNIGSGMANDKSSGMGFVASENEKNEKSKFYVQESFKKFFTPEFRNRITAVFNFNNLGINVLKSIVEKFLKQINLRMVEKGIVISLTDLAKEKIAKKASEMNLGGRPVEKLLNDEISENIVDEILYGKLENGGIVEVDVVDDKFTFNYSN